MQRRTTIPAAALLALLLVLIPATTAVASPTHPDEATDGPAVHPRRFFWMNAYRSSHDARAHRTASRRMHTDVTHLRQTRVDFGVLAETEPDQRADFRRFGRSTYALVTGHNPLDNVVFYRRSAFKLLGTRSMTTRYDHGQRVHTVIAMLQDRASGNVVAVIPVHNPRISAGPWRAIDLAKQVAHARRLHREHPSWEVVVAGDFNAEWTPACAFTHAGLLSPVTDRRHCHHAGLPIDQMFATRGLHPHDYRAVRTTTTDHRREYQAKLWL